MGNDRAPKVVGNWQLAVAAALLAAGYYILTISFSSISYGEVNFRVAGLLFAFVPIFGLPSIVGLGVGQFLANLSSPLGSLDLVSPLFGVSGFVIIFLLRKRGDLILYGGYLAHSLLISLWVSFIISFVEELPYLPLFYYVLIGNAIVDTGAFILYRIIRSRFYQQRGEEKHSVAEPKKASLLQSGLLHREE